jgi:hypothetical protein
MLLLLRLAALAAFCFFSWACGKNGAASKPATASSTPEAQKTTAFDAERAFKHVKAQVEFGPRPAGSEALAKTRDYLVSELKSYGLNVRLDEFTATTPPKVTAGKTKMANVIAELPGETDNVIALASHYDTKLFKEFKFVGANDGASSTGALLEIARVWAAENKTKRKYTYQFVFFDGEEAFCENWSDCLDGKDNTYGSRHMVERLKSEKKLDKLKALILLDMVGEKNVAMKLEENSTPWLSRTIWRVAHEAGYGKNFPMEPTNVEDDHSRFLSAGVAAVDLIDLEYAHWHTAEDTLDKLSSQSLKAAGEVVLLSLPKIEAQIK